MRITPRRWIVAGNAYRQLGDRSHVRGGICLLNLSSACVLYLFYFSPFASNLVPTNLTLNLRRLVSPQSYWETWLVFRAQLNTVKGMSWGCPVCLERLIRAMPGLGEPCCPAQYTTGDFGTKPHFWGKNHHQSPLTVPSSKESCGMLHGPRRMLPAHGLLQSKLTNF